MRSLFFPQNINGAQLDIQLGGGDGKGYYCARSAKKNVFPQPLTFLGRGGIFFSNFREN